MDVWWQLALIAVLVVVNAALAGSEVALISLRESQLNRLARSGGAGGSAARLARDPNRFLSAVQLGITLAGFLASAVAAISLAEPLIRPLGFVGEFAEPVAIVIVTLALTAVTLVFGELAPKRFAMQRAEAWARLAAPPLSALATATRPAIWLLSRSTDLLVRLLGGDPKKRADPISEEEVRDVISVGAASPEHRAILFGAWEIARRRLTDIVVPRRYVVAFSAETPAVVALKRLVEVTHSRAPVFGRDLDDVVGVVNLRDLIGASGTVGDHKRPVLMLPETARVLRALARMQDRQEQMAIVVNEYGGTEGIVTVEDLLEEVVGEINDEFDLDQRGAVRRDDGSVEVPGSMAVHDLHDMGVELPVGDYTTIGGLVMARLGRVAVAGDSVPVDGWTIAVLGVEDQAIQSVRILPTGSRPPS